MRTSMGENSQCGMNPMWEESHYGGNPYGPPSIYERSKSRADRYVRKSSSWERTFSIFIWNNIGMNPRNAVVFISIRKLHHYLFRVLQARLEAKINMISRFSSLQWQVQSVSKVTANNHATFPIQMYVNYSTDLRLLLPALNSNEFRRASKTLSKSEINKWKVLLVTILGGRISYWTDNTALSTLLWTKVFRILDE